MQQELLLLKSVAQLPLQPVYYDGVHELPIDQECVKNFAAHGTGLLRREPIQSCFVCSGSQQGANFYRSGRYSTTEEIIMLRLYAQD
ncbi:hypothetical protein CEQ31_012985 [Serratia odorifera]|nr:hypothetical protein CEQ31_012985 [Serratia odorifera]